MIRIVLALGALVVLASCASLSETQCRSGDWERIGLRDGADGRSPDFIATNADACADYGITPDVAAWEAGRQEGLKLYCTPSRAYDRGVDGFTFREEVCPAEMQTTLSRANRSGLRLHEIEDDISDTRREILHVESRLAKLPDDDPTRATLLRELSFLRLALMQLRTSRLRYL